jgi:hypothetical protein
MGNHSIDCDFCGRDQRSYGTSCCNQSHRKVEEEKQRRDKKRAARNRIIEQLKQEHPELQAYGPFSEWSYSKVEVDAFALANLLKLGLADGLFSL